MISPIRVDVKTGVITIMSKAFAKNAARFGTQEYTLLQKVRSDYPTFTVTERQIKKNTSMEHYKGLTYEYMRWYITTHEAEEVLEAKLAAFDEMLNISKCHSTGKRYATIKKEFLEAYPEVKLFGMSDEEKAKEEAKQKAEEEGGDVAENAPSSSKVVELPTDDESDELPAAV